MSEPWSARVYALLDETASPTLARTVVRGVLLLAIVVSTAVPVLDTVELLDDEFRAWFGLLTLITVGLFTVEYALRLWTAPCGLVDPTVHPWRARWHYARSPFGLIDLVAIVPAGIALLTPNPDPEWLSALYLLRILKVARYTPALHLFVAVLRAEANPLLSGLMVLGVLWVLESAVMYTLERDAQPQHFGSIPAAMWWAIVTITSVGYGDIAPVTPWGKVFASGVMILGVAMFALPAGILATGFANELRKRDFLVSWQMVARLPLFATLEAARIAEIAQLLHRQVVPARYAVVRRGEPADAMYFILSGQVEVDLFPTPKRLGAGDYFGEIALLTDSTRTATVTAIEECELLVLEVADFRRLLASRPELRATITAVATSRIAADAEMPVPPHGH